MKNKEWVFALTLTVIVVFMVYLESQTYKGESISQNKETAILTLTEAINNIDINRALIDRIDELTRQNTVLLQEVASQHAELKVYEGMAEK